MRELRLSPDESIEDKRSFFESLRTGEGFRAFAVDDDKIEEMAALFEVDIEDLGWSGYRRAFDTDEVVTSVDELDTIYEVGQWVEFDRTVIRRKPGNQCYVVRRFEEGMPWRGRICGLSSRKAGRVIGGGYRELPSFETTQSLLVWEVKRGLKNKPVYVHPNDITAIKVGDETLPTLHQKTHNLEALSEDMSEIMEGWPRDDQGRWLPKD